MDTEKWQECLHLDQGISKTTIINNNKWHIKYGASQVALVVKNVPANAGDIRDAGSISGLGRSPGSRHGNPLRYSYLENLHRQWRLAGYRARGHKESDVTEWLSTAQHKRRGCGNLWLTASCSEAQVITWTQDWHLKRELGAEEGLVVVSRLYLWLQTISKIHNSNTKRLPRSSWVKMGAKGKT